MSSIGPSILHRQIKGLKLSEVDRAVSWILVGALASLPKSLRTIGWKAESFLYKYNGVDSCVPYGIIEKSLTRDQRITVTNQDDGNLPIVVALESPLWFETTIDLPATAHATLPHTISLRMEDLCPIPIADAAFSIGAVSPQAHNRIQVDLAITKKETLRTAKRNFADRKIHMLSSAPNTRGHFQYCFERTYEKTQKTRCKWLITCVALWVCLILFTTSLQIRQKNLLLALEVEHSVLRDELHSLLNTRKQVQRIQEFAPHKLTLPDVSATIQAQVTTAPIGSVLSRISIDTNHIRVSGYTPTDNTPTHSEYPGFESFELTSIRAASEFKNGTQ